MRILQYLVLAILMSAPLAGYFFPVSTQVEEKMKEQEWSLSVVEKPAPVDPDLELLSGIWPVSVSSESVSKPDSASQPAPADWTLVAIIEEAGIRTALLLTPERNILSLSEGMSLDEHRTITKIGATQLTWMDNEQQSGIFKLYPEPITNELN